MKKFRVFIAIIFGLLVLFFISSCATIFNSKKTSIRIKPDNGIRILSVEKSIIKSDAFIIHRSADTLIVKFLSDTSISSIKVPPKKTLNYWGNFLNLGLGFIIDNRTTKRFSYPRKIFIENLDNTIKVSKFPTTRKGTVQVCFLFPYINSFFIRKSHDNFYSSQGFMGVGIGINFFYKNNNYVSMNCGSAIDYMIPFPVGVDYFGEHQQATIGYINLRHHNKIGRFDIGYGLNFSASKWTLFSGDSTNINISYNNISLGPSITSRFNLTKKISLGLVYQPSFINLNYKPTIDYQDFITIEAAIILNIIRPKMR